MILHLVTGYLSLPADSLEQCCTDTVILGCFTGGCCSEYWKARPPRVKPSAVSLSLCSLAPLDTGQSLLPPHDMKFYSADLTLVPASLAYALGPFVLLHFRFDKGGSNKNLSEWMYQHLPASTSQLAHTFCPLLTCLHINSHWTHLSSNPLTPIVKAKLPTSLKIP